VFNTTLTNISVISWRSVLLVDETEIPRENHRPATSHWHTLSCKVCTSRHERDSPWAGFDIVTIKLIHIEGN